jgi:hypothetical protein
VQINVFISPFHIWNLYSTIFFWKTMNYGVPIIAVPEMEVPEMEMFLSTRM